MKILIRNADYVLRHPSDAVKDCDVLIEGNRIAAVGRGLSATGDVEIIDAAGCAVLPGLINAHTHLYQNFLKGISEGISLVPWCNEVLFPTVGVLRDAVAENPRIPYVWTTMAAMEMIKGGVTCCINMDCIYPETPMAWRDAGFRGVLAYTLTNKWVPAELRGSEEEMRQKVLDMVAEFHHPESVTQVFLAPSTVFLCDESLLGWVREKSIELNLGVQIHISEIAGEVTDSIAETGLRPVEYLDSLGLINDRLSAVHCVHLNAKEIDILARSGAVVVTCPKSNMKLADGIAPVAEMKAAGIPIAVATDGCASNDLLDMWEEMRMGLLLARVAKNDPAVLCPQDALAMATENAALAARIEAGEIEPGKLADLIIVQLNAPHLQPLHDDDLANMLVFCGRANDVRDTIINGQVVMRSRRLTTIDEERVIAEAAELDKNLYALRQKYTFEHE